MKEIKNWYSSKIGKEQDEFDEFDNYICTVVKDKMYETLLAFSEFCRDDDESITFQQQVDTFLRWRN